MATAAHPTTSSRQRIPLHDPPLLSPPRHITQTSHSDPRKTTIIPLSRTRPPTQKVIDHKLNINLLIEACHNVHPEHRTPPTVRHHHHTSISRPSPFTTHTTTILTQLTATTDTYNRQLGSPPGAFALFYATYSGGYRYKRHHPSSPPYL